MAQPQLSTFISMIKSRKSFTESLACGLLRINLISKVNLSKELHFQDDLSTFFLKREQNIFLFNDRLITMFIWSPIGAIKIAAACFACDYCGYNLNMISKCNYTCRLYKYMAHSMSDIDSIINWCYYNATWSTKWPPAGQSPGFHFRIENIKT